MICVNIVMCMERQLSPQASGTFEVILSSREYVLLFPMSLT